VLYAGFDCSTQGLSLVVIDVNGARRSVVFRDSLSFDDDLPEFDTHHGVLPPPSPGVIHAPPLMWARALERMLGRLASHTDRARLGAISGSGQQHGSVYCGASPHVLTRATSPVWMDSSTVRECGEIESTLGGPSAVAQLTGSRAFPRFTGPQIRKFAREIPEDYARTIRIHLVSSYLASLLIDDHAPIDHADGSGMNLMDIRTRTWAEAALQATAPDLADRLPPLVPSSAVIGRLARRWQTRFDLPGAKIAAWSGDNPCSLIGTGLVIEGSLGVSLGTSDTVFGPMQEPRVSPDGTGHVFASPTGEYMGITVFQNGSLARERIRDQFGLDWNGFSAALAATEPGNGGAMMLPWFDPEITPAVPRPGAILEGLDGAPPARHVRAVVEGQMMALARHSGWMGVSPHIVYATGGAAANRQILQVMADVFAADVYQFEATDSAALGAALRAWQADSGLPWAEVVSAFASPVDGSRIALVTSHVTTYRALHGRYTDLERRARGG
jgi:xylulokinase